MGLYQNLIDIINVLYFDEELLRLLYCSPANLAKNIPDPLDTSLPNIMDMPEKDQWNIRNERILFTPKVNDLAPDKPLCRLLVYVGRRTPERNSYLMAEQEIIVDILCHFDFENRDLRSTRISDRLSQLFCQENITGIGKMNFVGAGQIRSTPTEYVGLQVIYRFGEFNK